MSVLSDDTDVLLLIPPDFFAIPSDSDEEPPKQSIPESLIVSDLITQVNDLEGRICQIENRCLSEMTGNLQHHRQYGSADTLNYSVKSGLNTRSLQGTPVKTPLKCGEHSPLKRTQFPLEMRDNMLTSNNYVLQKDRDEQLLKEIDQFFKNRNNNDEDNERTADLTKPEGPQSSTTVFNLNKVNDLLKKLDETQKEVEEKIKLSEIAELENEDSIDFGSSDEGRDKVSEQLKNAKRVLTFMDEVKKDETVISSAEFHCGEDSAGSVCKSREVCDKKQLKTHEISNLLSLSNLWGSSVNVHRNNSIAEDDPLLKQKFQEEKCRRQHCESLIHQLQIRLLEEQQKIAVAIKVDQEKDQAISKLTEGWSKLVGHWRDLENQRNNLAKKLLSDREKFKTEMSTAYQTVKRYEVELSKALDLAHGYKEKCEASDREKKTVRVSAAKETENLRTELRDALEKLRAEEGRTEKLEKLVNAKEELINQSRVKTSELQNQIREGKKTLKELQVELENVKVDRDKLGERLKEERARLATAEQSKKTLQHQNEELKKKEKALKDEVKMLTQQMEKIKLELKEFYQEQVESIVQEKLKEFQEQLAAAEKALQTEIEMREKTVTEMAVKQVQQIAEKHLAEVNALEERHREESESWKSKVAQKDEKIKELQKKLDQCLSNKTMIAQRLHSVMEAQWQEALKIITASSPQQVKSPPASARSESVTRQNTFTMTSWGEGKSSTSTSSPPFCQEGLVTFREEPKTTEALTYRVDETPQKMSSDHLKKYIKTLLERAPGHPLNDTLESTAYNCVDSLTDESSLNQWQHILSEPSSSHLTSDLSKYSESIKPSKEAKPSWK